MGSWKGPVRRNNQELRLRQDPADKSRFVLRATAEFKTLLEVRSVAFADATEELIWK
jgi:hypothetical protein